MTEAPTATLHLHLVEGPLAGLQLTTGDADRYQIGRTRTTKVKGLQIKDPDISEKHAELVWQAGQWSVRDLGSTNGTQLNGLELESRGDPVALKTGDVLRFGTSTTANVMIDVELEDVTVAQYLQSECSQLELLIKARAAAVAQQLKLKWQAAKGQLLLDAH